MKEKENHQFSPEIKDIIVDIYEFLKWAELDRTCSTLATECNREKNFDLKAIAKSVSLFKTTSETKEHLLQAFEETDSEDFWELWYSVFPQADAGTTLSILEFLLKVYFATEPLRKTNSRRNSYQAAINSLKSEVESSNQLSEIEELVPYFLLPFMENPKHSALFKEISQGKWVRMIKRRLENQLAATVSAPKLLAIVRDKETDKSTASSRDGKDNIDSSRVQKKLANTERIANSYKNRHGLLQKDYHKLIGIATELVDALEQTFQGSPVSPEYFQEISTRLLESTQMHLNDESPKRELSSETSPKKPPLPPKKEVVPLNYSKLRNQLIQQPNSRESAFLLQALRHQLTRTNNDQRAEVLKDFSTNDVLGLKNSHNAVSSIFNAESQESKQSLARFLNGMSSTKAGRNYLTSVSQGKHFLSTVVSTLKTRKVADFSQGHCLAALQKLSLRRRVQTELIRLGTIDWLVLFLTNYSRLADYSLEYGTALLMNLSLNSAGKQACAKNSENLVKLLISLLKHNNTEIHPYINGILYSTLSISKIRTKARDLDMEQLLESAMKDPKTKEDSKQLPYVLKQLKGELGDETKSQSSDEESTNDEDEDEEEDYLETELDSTDPLKPKTSELSGDNLLKQRYKSLPSTATISTHRRSIPSSKPIPPEEAPPGIVPQDLPLETGLKLERNTVSRGTYTVQNDRGKPPDKVRPFGKAQPTPTIRRRSRSPQRENTQRSLPTTKIDVTNSPQKRPQPTPAQKISARKGAASDSDLRRPVEPPRQTTATITRGRTTVLATRQPEPTRQPDPAPDPSSSPPTRRHRPQTSKVKLPPPPENKTEQKPKETDKSKDTGRSTDRSTAAPAPTPSATQWVEASGVSAPVVGRIKTRIPGDAKQDDYIAAFGSRPKVVRTPDQENIKKRNMVMFF